MFIHHSSTWSTSASGTNTTRFMECYVNKKLNIRAVDLRFHSQIFNFHLENWRTRFFLAFVFRYLLLFHNSSETLELSVNRLWKIVMSKGGSRRWPSNCERFNETAFTACTKATSRLWTFYKCLLSARFFNVSFCIVLREELRVHAEYYAPY